MDTHTHTRTHAHAETDRRPLHERIDRGFGLPALERAGNKHNEPRQRMASEAHTERNNGDRDTTRLVFIKQKENAECINKSATSGMGC